MKRNSVSLSYDHEVNKEKHANGEPHDTCQPRDLTVEYDLLSRDEFLTTKHLQIQYLLWSVCVCAIPIRKEKSIETYHSVSPLSTLGVQLIRELIHL